MLKVVDDRTMTALDTRSNILKYRYVKTGLEQQLAFAS